jgi:hypothetical protein
MKRSSIGAALLCALCVPLAAHAAVTPEVSAFAMPTIALSEETTEGLVAGNVSNEWRFTPAPPRPYESVRYRPRHPAYYPPPPPQSSPSPHASRSEWPKTVAELHGGVFDPEGETSQNGYLLGSRFGLQFNPQIQMGALIDWHHKGDRESQIISTGTGPGGQEIVTQREIGNTSSDLLPMLGYLQISAARLPLTPYFGIGGGYEALFLHAEDFQTGTHFDATFGGFGWQAWGGASLRLGESARLNAEAFMNEAELGRDFVDPISGEIFRETVKQNGVGVRGGLSFGF